MFISKIFYIFFIVSIVFALDNGLGFTPPMGWNSRNSLGCNITQQAIKNTANLLISNGLASLGYKYLNIDDCWQMSRDEKGYIIEDHIKFPSKLSSLSSYIHQRGLLFGLESDAGQFTCQNKPGGYGFQQKDAETYAQWKVDYLKYDNCYNLSITGKVRYFAMMKALNATGRHIFYSMSNSGAQQSWTWASPFANSWRTTENLEDNWDSFIRVLDSQINLGKYAQKGGWNDPDILLVGNKGMNFNQYYAHFALWCLLKAPLIVGCQLQNITKQSLTILKNQQLIRINQDSLGIQADLRKSDIYQCGKVQVWGGPLEDSQYVVGFFNRCQQQKIMSISVRKDLNQDFDSFSIRDVIRHVDKGLSLSDELKVGINGHSIQVFVLKFYKTQKMSKLREQS